MKRTVLIFILSLLAVQTANAAYLNVTLVTPLGVKNVSQNTTFYVNATVTCVDGPCGNVSAVIRYNSSGPDPDANLSARVTTPLYADTGFNKTLNLSGTGKFAEAGGHSAAYASRDNLVFISAGNIGGFGVYNISANVTYNLSGTDGGDWIGASGIFPLAYDSMDNLVFLAGNDGVFGFYNISANVTYDLRGTDQLNWIGTSWIVTLAYDSRADMVFLGGQNMTLGGLFGVYNISSNITSDLRTTDGGDWMSTRDIWIMTYDPRGDVIFFGGQNGMFGFYNKSSNTAYNLGGTGAESIFGGNLIEGLAYDSRNNLVFMSGEAGKFAVYNISANVTYNLSGTDGGDWIATSQINDLTYDPRNDLVFLGIDDGKFGVYNISANVTYDLSNTDDGDWRLESDIYGLAVDYKNNKVYLTGQFGLGVYKPTGSSHVICDLTYYSSCTPSWPVRALSPGNLTIDVNFSSDAAAINSNDTTNAVIQVFPGCGFTLSNNFTLFENLTASTGNCFTIEDNGITLDGAGHTIRANPGSSGIGINSEGFSGLTIKNLILEDFFTAVSSISDTNILLLNNTIINGSEGVRIETADSFNITQNTILSPDTYGIVLNSDVFNGVVTDNTIITDSAVYYGFFASGSGNFSFSSNILQNTGVNSTAVYSAIISQNFSMEYNDITSTGSNSTSILILHESVFTSYDSIKIKNNNISCPQCTAINISGTNRVIVASNNIQSNNGMGVFLNHANDTNITGGFVNSTVEIFLTPASLRTNITNVIMDGVNLTSHYVRGVVLKFLSSVPENPAGKSNLSYYINITNLSAASYIDFNISYIQSDVSGMDESSIRIYHYNISSSAWEVLPASSVDTVNNVVASGNVSSFSPFGPFGDSSPYLEAILLYPSYALVSNVAQNGTFAVNANVTCRNGACGKVNGTARYNFSSAAPADYVNTTFGDVPLWLSSSYFRPSRNTTAASGVGSSVNNPENAYDGGFSDATTFAETISIATGFAEVNYTFDLTKYYNLTAVLYITTAKDVVAAAGDVSIYNFTSGQFVLWFSPTFTSVTTNFTNINSSDGLVNSTGHAIIRIRSDDNTISERVRVYDIHVKTPNTKECGSLDSSDSCTLEWRVNATGAIGRTYALDVLFISDSIQQNNTLPGNVTITNCIVDFSLWDSAIDFGTLNPNIKQNSAPGNANSLYNITVNPGSCNIDFFIKGTNLTNSSFTNYIGVGNITWSNVSNTYSSSANLTGEDVPVRLNVPALTNVTTWYWINVPSVYAGIYNGTISIGGAESV